MRWPPPTTRLRARLAPWRPVLLSALLILAATLSGCATGAISRQIPGGSSSSAIQMSGPIGCVAPSKPSPAGGCVVTDAKTGISLRVADAYADVTGTIVRLATTNTYNYPLSVSQAQLALPSGYILKDGNGGMSGGAFALIADEPLPPQEMKLPVHLIATARFAPPTYNGMFPPTLPPAPPWLNTIYNIPLSLTFTINPARSGSYTFHQAPTVAQGIGVQVESLDTSPAHTAFFGQAGGARIRLRFTGLPKDMELLSFILVASQRTINGGTGGDNGPGLVQLHIPGMSVGAPAGTFLLSPEWPATSQGPSTAPTVGAAGTVEFEAVYLGSGTPTGEPATLAISDIRLLTGGEDATSTSTAQLPSYQFTLPLK